MNVRRLVLLAVPLAFFTVACNKAAVSTNSNPKSTSTAAATPDAFAAARATFVKNCQKCHGEQGTGGPVKLEDGTKLKVPSFREGHALHHPDSDYLKQINKGGEGMPAFKDKLTPQQIDELVRFIRHEFQGGMTPPAEPMMSPMKNMNMKDRKMK